LEKWASSRLSAIGRRLNLLDENFPQDQRFLLRDWHVPFRQIGCEIAAAGTQDLEIIPPVHAWEG
jgi:hypothetical protein